MNKLITPMLVQYLVGLCCVRVHADSVDVTLGDMVLDPAADKKRDVDVTVTMREPDGGVTAFKAYEVKKESAPLDVSTVEQLCAKLNDMPSVTHRAIVSASGFSDGAIRKASHHGVDLYIIVPWTRPIKDQFPELGLERVPQECMRFQKNLLYWPRASLHLVVPTAKMPFSVGENDALYGKSGKPHNKYKSFAEFRHEILFRSTEFLCNQEPAISVARIFPQLTTEPERGIYFGPDWPHTHTLDVGSDEVYLKVGDVIEKLAGVTVNGSLQWQLTVEQPDYYVIERVPDGKTLSGAVVSMGVREGTMFSLTFSPESRTVGIEFVRLAEKHWNAIRNLKIRESSSAGP